ncbi:hypothetical protein QZH41_003161 [Actinostola sp. cb2023]|nr:hypothetical protein QZH41_003161 [Actinostola sp. cb2023]
MQRDEDNDVSGELAALMTAYRDAPSRNVKIQILSLYAYRYPAEKLIKLHEPYETLTHWQIKQARKHAKAFGPGVVDSKPVQHRVRLSMPKVDHFIDFTNRPYFWQDVAFGTRILKLDSGQKVTMPNVIRTVTRSTMINQYYQYCKEDKFSPLSRATLFKILDVRGASQRKCLQGLDNIATDGAAGFETWEKIVDELGESALRDVSKRTRVTISRLDHSEAQHGKDICDRILCPMKAAIRTFSNECHDIVNARDMQTALDERPVKGTTAAVCSVNEAGKTVEVKKIDGFSKYHNFSFEKDGVRVWRCYGIGRGKLVPYKRLILKPQGPTGMIVEEPFFDMRQSRDFNLGDPKTDHDKRQPLFSCTQPGCTESFVKFSDLELHLDVGEHSPRSTTAIRTFSNECHDIVNARDMQTALDERPVKGTTAAVCSVNEAGKTVEVKKIDGFSKYHNFSFEKDGVRVWRCYGIGRGKLVPYKRLILKPQGPTGMIVEEPFFDMRQSRDFNLGDPKTDHDKRQPLFSCTQPRCTESFVKFSDLELHLDVGEHSPRSTSMYDKIRKD